MVDFLTKSLWVTLRLPLYRWLTVTKMIHLTSFFLFRSVTAVVLVKFGLASTQKCGWRWKSDPGQGFYRKQLSPLVGNRKLTVSSVDPSFTSRTECEVMTFFIGSWFVEVCGRFGRCCCLCAFDLIGNKNELWDSESGLENAHSSEVLVLPRSSQCSHIKRISCMLLAC